MAVLERSELEASPLADLHAIANQVGNHAGNNAPMNVLAVILIAAGIGYIYIIVKH